VAVFTERYGLNILNTIQGNLSLQRVNWGFHERSLLDSNLFFVPWLVGTELDTMTPVARASLVTSPMEGRVRVFGGVLFHGRGDT
jgi:hypothetical protein